MLLQPASNVVNMAASAKPTKSEIARAAHLRDTLNQHNERYFTHDSPDVSDAEYDELKRELIALEAKHPSLITLDSPTAQIGATTLTTFAPVTHRAPMTLPTPNELSGSPTSKCATTTGTMQRAVVSEIG